MEHRHIGRLLKETNSGRKRRRKEARREIYQQMLVCVGAQIKLIRGLQVKLLAGQLMPYPVVVE